jgi:hypothetical protein
LKRHLIKPHPQNRGGGIKKCGFLARLRAKNPHF